MIFECNNGIARIIGVEHVLWKAGSFDIAPREYAALTFRISGSAKIKVDKKTYSVNTNEVLYMPQGAAYKAEYSDTEILAVHFVTDKNDTAPEIYSLTNTEHIYQAFLKANTLWKSKEPGFVPCVMAQIYRILGLLSKNEISEKMPEHFVKAVSYINSSYTSCTLCAESICKSVGISATTLRQLFKRYYKKTPTEYITGLRLEYARELISCGTPIEQAAERSGFNDSKYFSRVVKKYFHCTPRQLKAYGR